MDKRPRILVVDDSEAFRRLVRASLEPEGFAGTLTQCRMVDRVIDLEQVLRKPLMQCAKRPTGMLSRVHAFRHLTDSRLRDSDSTI